MKLDFEQRQRSGKLADEMAAADELGNYADVIIYLRDEIAKLQQPSLASAAREIAREIVQYFKDLQSATYEEMQTDVEAIMERHLHSAQPGWVSTADSLPEDDSDVFAAIWWINGDNPAYSQYAIHDCSYYEGGTGSGQKIFTDCEGEEFEAADVAYWIYKKDLAAQFKPPVAAQPGPEINLNCTDCDRPKDDINFHFNAPGTNWGAALHWYKPPREGK